MGFFDRLKKHDGGYIFISHSHDDIEKIRKIRNELEQNGFEPLCFYLKCLRDKDEIEDLIKREIDAREWFLFVDSENSRKSNWVKMEREYIESTNEKKIITVDISDDKAVKKAVEKIIHNLRIFISYSRRDQAIAKRINECLKKKDYLTFLDLEDLMAGDFVVQINNAIVEASEDGCVLLLVTENSLKSEWVLKEVLFAVSKGGNIISVIIGNIDLTDYPKWNEVLSYTNILHLKSEPEVEDINELVNSISDLIIEQ